MTRAHLLNNSTGVNVAQRARALGICMHVLGATKRCSGGAAILLAEIAMKVRVKAILPETRAVDLKRASPYVYKHSTYVHKVDSAI